jgi:PIN domain nuclease of toxin-antitoxin system
LKPDGSGNLALLLDTQILVWIGSGNPRLPNHVRRQILDADATLFVSAVTAWEFVDLEDRLRFPDGVSFAPIVDRLDATLLDYPADAWKVVRQLPKVHLDPVDRMVIAHAIVADLTLVTADAEMRAYPVKTLWSS